MHLYPSTTNGIIYIDKSHGDLVVQRVEKLKNNIKMTISEDNAVRRVFKVIIKYAAFIQQTTTTIQYDNDYNSHTKQRKLRHVKS